MDLDFVFMDLAKIELGQYPAILTEKAWSMTHILFAVTELPSATEVLVFQHRAIVF